MIPPVLYVKSITHETPSIFASVFRPQKTLALNALADWKRFSNPPIVARAEQPDPAWRKMERLLRRHGWTPDAPLTYRQVQALCSWRNDLVIDFLEPEVASGGGRSQDGGGAQTDGAAAGWPGTTPGGGQAQVEGSGAQGLRARASTPRKGRKPLRRTPRAIRLWHPWPQPSKERVVRARTMLHLVQEELAEDAREAIAVGWRYERLAVRQEMGQLDPARNWERLALPRLLLALDFSGSIGGFVSEVAALGATLAAAFPWLVVAAAPNAALEPLTTVNDKQIIVDGEWRRLPGALPPERQNNAEQWRMIDRLWPVRAAVYVGDWEAWRMADAFAGRFGVLSVYQANYGAPIRTDHAYGASTPWPTVIRCNSVDDFLAATPVIIRALLR